MIRTTTIEKFNSRILPVTESGCWLWTGGWNTYGYGSFYAHGENMGAHRYSYLLYRGIIPEGMTVDHLCRVRCCVNPAHLTLKTNKENVLCGLGRTANNARKTYCARGHMFDEANTILRKTGGRTCRVCAREDRKKYQRMAKKQ